MKTKSSQSKLKINKNQLKWFVMESVPSNINPTLTYSYVNSDYIEKLFKDNSIKDTPKKYVVIFSRGGYQLCFPKKKL